jgi:hypothetical protein
MSSYYFLEVLINWRQLFLSPRRRRGRNIITGGFRVVSDPAAGGEIIKRNFAGYQGLQPLKKPLAGE